MSAPSGIKVPPSVSEAYAHARSSADEVRAVVFVIEGESFTVASTLPPKGSYSDDIALLPPALPSKQTPASFAYRLDSKAGGSYEWMMVTFVPDDAGVRAKMLQASSRSGLMKALGANNFKHDWFATSLDDLTPRALKSHLDHILSPPPLTASEAALAEIKAAEADEARRIALDGETAAARRKAVIGLGGKTQWQEGVTDALEKAAARSDDGWIVTLEIDQKSTGSINLGRSEACKPSEVASKLPEKSPCYVFYSYPTPPAPKPAPAAPVASAPAAARDLFQATAGGARPVAASNAPRYDAEEKAEGDKAEDKEESAEDKAEDAEVSKEEDADDKADDKADITGLKISDEPSSSPIETTQPAEPEPAVDEKGRVVFIYWCPSGSPVRFRMVYSTTVRGIQQDAIDKVGMQIAGKLETSDKSDLAESAIREAAGKPSGPSSSAFSAAPRAPKHSNSLPMPASRPGRFGSPAFGATGSASGSPTTPTTPPVFGAPAGPGFGRPMPGRTSSTASATSAASAPASTPAEEGDSKDRIASAFNAFGPRVGGASPGFARPKPAGRR